MSRSPEVETVSSEYDLAWQAINELIRAEGSWSGRERNNSYLNLGDGTFVEVSGAVGLDFAEDGRALAAWDYDRDGDLDLLLKNRNGPQLRLLRNDVPAGRRLAVRLIGEAGNRDAVGARVSIRVGERWRTAPVVSGSGFLSQSSRVLHFGLAPAETVSELRIVWPGGRTQVWTGLSSGEGLLVVREGADEIALEPFRPSSAGQPAEALPSPDPARGHSWLAVPAPAPSLGLVDLDGNLADLEDLGEGYRLVNFWATWCGPCRGELSEWSRRYETLRESGVGVLAVSVDDAGDRQRVETFRRELQMPFPVAHASVDLIRRYNIFYRSLFTRRTDMQIPTTLLIDPEGRVRRLYRGPVDPDRVLGDVEALRRSRLPEPAARPFDGRAVDFAVARDDFPLGTEYLKAGFHSDAILVFEQVVVERPAEAEAWGNLGVAYLEAGRLQQAQRAFSEALQLRPDYVEAALNLGQLALSVNRTEEARSLLEQAARLAPGESRAQMPLALLEARTGRPERAIEIVGRYLEHRPTDAEAWNSQGIFLAQAGRLDEAVEAFALAIELEPDLGEAYLNLGRAQLESGRTEAAVTSLQQAARLLPEQPPVHYYLARALLASGDRSAARQALERVLELDPASVEARRLLDTVGGAPDGGSRR